MRIKVVYENGDDVSMKSWFAFQDHDANLTTIEQLLKRLCQQFKIQDTGLNWQLILDNFPLPLNGKTMLFIRDNDTLTISPIDNCDIVELIGTSSKRRAIESPQSTQKKVKTLNEETNVATQMNSLESQTQSFSKSVTKNAYITEKNVVHSEDEDAVNITIEQPTAESSSESKSCSTSSESSDSESPSTTDKNESSSSSDSNSSDSEEESSSSESETDSSESKASTNQIPVISSPKSLTLKKTVIESTGTKDIKIPANLHRNKRKSVMNMQHIPASHFIFTVDDSEETEEVLDEFGKKFQIPPKVHYTEARLYTPPGTFSESQLSRQRKAKKNNVTTSNDQDQRVEEDVDACQEFDSIPVVDTDAFEGIESLGDFSSLPIVGTPVEGQIIAYKCIELSASYTAEISEYKVGKILQIVRNKKAIVVTLQNSASQGVAKTTAKSGWEPKINKLISKDTSMENRFSMQFEDESGIVLESDVIEPIVTLEWSELIEPRLVK
ncbi:hypothetical protein BC833DRAFT_583868 [Globomyces pollinis-pini]|nr:hypothetical protein BC833DRAFT_583868 [Globomyces pollinis-pini]